jgi:hypothetical protein
MSLLYVVRLPRRSRRKSWRLEAMPRLRLMGAFTSIQLRTILEENHHHFQVVEHNLQLYEMARDMAAALPRP